MLQLLIHDLLLLPSLALEPLGDEGGVHLLGRGAARQRDRQRDSCVGDKFQLASTYNFGALVHDLSSAILGGGSTS